MPAYRRDMDVRSDSTLWIRPKARHFEGATPITADLRCEVAIVGAGVSGALVAHHLAKRGVDVIVLDRDQPASGSTAACTALLQYELDQPLTAIAKKHSLAHAASAYRTCVSALGWMLEHVESLADRCDLQQRKTLLLARKKRDIASMKEETHARQAAGIDVRWLDEQKLLEHYQIQRPGAIESPVSLELDPYRLTVATLDAAVGWGARVFAPAEVVDYSFEDAGVVLRLSHGPVVRAKKVVIASGYETPPFLRQRYGKLLSTWAVASKPIDLDRYWSARQMVWEWGSAYLYARTTTDNRLVFGGGDRGFTNAKLRDRLIPLKTASLVRQVQKLVPGLEIEPAYQWAGTFAETDDGMPYIGSHPDFPNAYMALGYGGNGVTFSLIAARILTGLLTDDAELAEARDLFSFQR